jgi:hypothetical protein
MRKGLVAALAVIVVAGAAVAAVPMLEQRAARQIKGEIERDGTTKVDSVEVGLFDRKIVLNGLQGARMGEINIGHWEASGLAWPMGELLEGRTPLSGLKLGDPLQAKHLEVRDLTMVQDKARWSVASLAIDDFSLDRYDAAVGPGQFSHLAARILAALSMGHLEQKGTTVTNTTSNERLAIESLTIGRFDKGHVGAMVMTGFEFGGKPPGEPMFRMAEFKIGDLDFQRGLKAMGDVAWRPGMPLGRIDLGSASLTGFGGEALRRYGVTLGGITHQSKYESKDVRHSRLRIEGFVLDPPAGKREALQVRIVLQAMGLKQLKLEMDCSGTEDRAKGEIGVDRCAVTGPDLGEVDLSFKVVQADAPFWQAIDEGNTFALLGSKAGLGSAKVVIADRGLVDRVVKAFAATTGQAPTAVRAAFAEEVRRYQPPGVLITEDFSKLLDTAARFIERGGTFTLEARPASPIGLDKAQYFSQPGPDLVDVLGLSATLSP